VFARVRPDILGRRIEPAAHKKNRRLSAGGSQITEGSVPAGGAPAARLKKAGSAIPGEELHDVVEAEPTITALADAIERQLAAVAQALDCVDVQMQEACDLARRQHRAQLVDTH